MDWTDSVMELSSSVGWGPKEMSFVDWKCDGGTRCVVVAAGTDVGERTIAGGFN